MMDGAQITIPDFEDTMGSTPTPFGRAGYGFGSSGFGSASSLPTSFLPSERSFFSHTREDSSTSVESIASMTTKVASKSTVSHSAQPSLANNISKKSSFASLRNAFKSTKHSEPPPVPPLENPPYPALKNPFGNRSTSSLNQGSQSPLESKALRGTVLTKSRSHGPTRSYQSQSGSILQNPEAGSDQFVFPLHPPVPRIPSAYGRMYQEELLSEVEDEKIVMDLKAPADYALHAIFIRFASSAEEKIENFLRQPLEKDSLLTDYFGPGTDIAFDETLNSLGLISQRHAKQVIDSILRWRRTQIESVGSDLISFHMSNRAIRATDVPGFLNERKSLASIYIMCRALISVLALLSKGSLGDSLGFNLEETTFDQLRKPDRKGLQQSSNHSINSELYATLLGHLASVRFVSVTDRFLGELVPVAQGQMSKDPTKYENIVRGLRHIRIKVWPPEAFEEGAEFMESLSKSFVNAHGSSLKIAFAESLLLLLHPIGKSVQAETNHPEWAKAMEAVFPRAKEMMNKPRYWPSAFPLAITCLCMGPLSLFLKHWVAFSDSAISKFKERPYRIFILNGLTRIIWTYVYRCQESASTTRGKLENFLKHFLPSNRTSALSEDLLETLTYIIHFILSRHTEFGRELCLELLQESAINGLQQKGGNLGSILAPERISIVINAILLSLHNLEHEIPTPAWPTTHDFSVMPSREDYPSSSGYLPPAILKPGLQDFLDRSGLTLATVTAYCGNLVGSMSVFDDQWAFSKLSPVIEESNNYIVRQHSNGITVAYPSNCSPHISVLNTAFQAWPRFLHPSIELSDIIDLLLLGVVHVEPSLAESATTCLKRFMANEIHSLQVISRANNFLYHPNNMCHDSGMKLLAEHPALLALWFDLVEDWIHSIIRQGIINSPHVDQIAYKSLEIEAAALFLLSHVSDKIHSIGVKIVRLLGSLASHSASSAVTIGHPLYIVERLRGMKQDRNYLTGYDDLLDKSEQSRLEHWRKCEEEDAALQIVESPNEKDRKLWRFVYPTLLRECTRHSGQTLDFLREAIISVVSRYHPSISHLAGLSSRMPANLSSRNAVDKDGFKLVVENRPMIYQWHLWMKILCAIPPDSPRSTLPASSRVPQDSTFERERYLTTRGLFRHLTPFLDSEYTIFRDAAVLCISSFPAHAYQYLLEDLNLLAGRQFYDDFRFKVPNSASSESSTFILGARQVHDEIRSRSNSSTTLIDRTRRQERLHSAVARIYLITAPLFDQQMSAARPAALSNILKFARSTQTFLSAPEIRDNPNLNRLRRYFCGVVEHLFSGLDNLKDSDRFIPSQMHLTLYRLCDDWCHVGPMTASARELEARMTRSVELSESGDRNSLQRFRLELSLLSNAAAGALTSLCPRAFYPSDLSNISPTEPISPDSLQPLTTPMVLNRLSAILASSNGPNLMKAKNALRALISHTEVSQDLLQEVLRGSIVISDDISQASSYYIFEVIAQAVVSERHHFTFSQIVCICLTNLRHPTLKVRMLAFHTLSSIHHQHSGLLTMSIFESHISSLAPVTHLHAHRFISDFLAGEHPRRAVEFLAQLGLWLSQMPSSAKPTNATLLLLQGLESWVPNLTLVSEDQIGLTAEGITSLYHLTSLTLRFGRSHAEQILFLWTKLVDPPHQINGPATIRFLLEQAHKVGSTLFITCASNIIASLCQTHIGRQVFEELCTVIEPFQILPNVEHKLGLPPPDKQQLWEDLDAIFGGDQPRLSLGSAQFAWLFLSDVALQRYWEMKDQLPVILHAIFTHIDNHVIFIRQRAQVMLFQILRSWTPGYDELPDRSTTRTRSSLQDSINIFEQEAEQYFWKEEESTSTVFLKMKTLLGKVLGYLEPLAPQLIGQWGSLALTWGTACSIRVIAVRSLQIFRALMPRIKKVDFALLVGRLSSTIAASDPNIQAFTAEMIETIDAVANADELDKTLISPVYWCTCACLSTPVEQEFLRLVHLMQSLLKRIDLGDHTVVDQIVSQQPLDWSGSPFLQPALLKGLRSSVTATATIEVLQTLSQFQDNRLIDGSGGRLRDLYTIALPWCLHAMDNQDPSVRRFAENIGLLAASEKRLSIQRIMNSYSKNHFRTRDDFLRQSVFCLREFGTENCTEIVTLLLGLILNEEQWLRIIAMQVLKILFQQREARNVELLGSELLMPLLRLLETDLAPQALEVLEEPLIIAGGPAARHILRMSMHFGSQPSLHSDPGSTPLIFGVPQQSGWSIAQDDALRDSCCANIMAVFDSCSVPTRPSRIEFEPEVESLASIKTPSANDGLVKNNNNFFNGESSDMGAETTDVKRKLSTRKLEARVAAILAKSSAPEAYNDTPQTPFLDVFNVGGVDEGDDSDEFSDIDSETDAFVFDAISPS